MLSKADLHVHTGYSMDSFSSLIWVVHRAIKKEFKIIAITDHETIKGAQWMKKYVKENNLPLEIIIGEEIFSTGGHVVGLFLTHQIESHQSLEDTLKEIKKQGGMAIIPHIGFSERKNHKKFYFRVSYNELLNHPELLRMVDGIEVTNFTLFEKGYEPKARFINEKFLKKAEIGSSDAHIVPHIGTSFTYFEGSTIEDLKKAILEKKTAAYMNPRFYTTGDMIKNFTACVKIPFYYIKKWIEKAISGA